MTVVGMRLRSDWLIGAALMLVAGSCNDGGALRDPGAAKAASLPATVPAATSGRTIVPPPRRDFQLTGELTQGGWLRGQTPQDAVTVMLDGQPVALERDGAFLIAFDRDAGPSATLTARLADGSSVSRPLVIAPRDWKIEHVAVGPRPGALPSAEYQRRRTGELARINAARAVNAASEGWRQQFIWPARGRLSGLFGSQRIYRGTPGSYHSGLDIATGESGTPFVAPADGVVILAADSPFTLEGNLLMIDHGMGLNSAFLHSSQLLVREGDRVRQGQVIGRIGMTGRATGPHLHWSMKWGKARLDPLLFTGPMRP